jgi:hypothetical protein
MTTPATPTNKTVYAAVAMFNIPKNDDRLTTICAHNFMQMHEDYVTLVINLFNDVFNNFGYLGRSGFDVKATRNSPTSKEYTLTMSHPSWETPYIATVIPGESGIQEVFDYCLFNAIVDGRSIAKHLYDDDYLAEGKGITVVERVFYPPENTPLHYVSMAFNDTTNGAMVSYVDAQTDFVVLMQNLLNNMGSYGNTQFKIANATCEPTSDGRVGDMAYHLTVEHSSWTVPANIRMTTGQQTFFAYSSLEPCWNAVTKSDGAGRDGTIFDLMREPFGVTGKLDIVTCMGTYPRMPKIKMPWNKFKGED